jgi:hypothetical protein
VVAFISLIVATGFIWALGKIFHIERIFYGPDRPVAVCAPGTMVEKVLPQISSVEVSITPLAYTGKAKRTQDRFNLSAEEGATITWNIKTNVAIKKASLLFNDKEQITLKSNNNRTEWHAAKAIDKPGFYQVSIDGKLSDLYYVQVIKDGHL